MVSIPGAEKRYPTMPSSQRVRYFDTHHFGPEDYPGGWGGPHQRPVPPRHPLLHGRVTQLRRSVGAGRATLEGDQIGVYDLSGDWSGQGNKPFLSPDKSIYQRSRLPGRRSRGTIDPRHATSTRPSGREVSQSGTGRGAGTAGSPPVRRASRRSSTPKASGQLTIATRYSTGRPRT